MLIRGRVTTIPNDTAVPNGTEGEIRLLSDDSLVSTVTTTDGWYDYSQNGHPGPFRVFFDYSNVIKNQYSTVTGPSGAVNLASIPYVFKAFADGVIDNIGNEAAVSATGSNMNVAVATGAVLVDGMLYDQLTATSYTVTTAHATLPRIDTICVEVLGINYPDEDMRGRTRIIIKPGTAAASPVAPTLTQTAGVTWEYPLANILVGAAVTVIGSDKVTDRRTYARTTIPADSITPTELSDDALALYLVKESGVSVNTVPINRLNFNGDDFDLTVNAGFDSKQIDISLASTAIGTARGSFMPSTEFVASGNLSSGNRTLTTFGVGPLPNNVQYAVLAYLGVTVRNSGTTGTVGLKMTIDGGTERLHEFQNVGGVPRWISITQTALVTKSPSASFDVWCRVDYRSGDASDIRAGWLQVVAIPASVLVP